MPQGYPIWSGAFWNANERERLEKKRADEEFERELIKEAQRAGYSRDQAREIAGMQIEGDKERQLMAGETALAEANMRETAEGNRRRESDAAATERARLGITLPHTLARQDDDEKRRQEMEYLNTALAEKYVLDGMTRDDAEAKAAADTRTLYAESQTGGVYSNLGKVRADRARLPYIPARVRTEEDIAYNTGSNQLMKLQEERDSLVEDYMARRQADQARLKAITSESLFTADNPHAKLIPSLINLTSTLTREQGLNDRYLPTAELKAADINTRRAQLSGDVPPPVTIDPTTKRVVPGTNAPATKMPVFYRPRGETPRSETNAAPEVPVTPAPPAPTADTNAPAKPWGSYDGTWTAPQLDPRHAERVLSPLLERFGIKLPSR
jgi:hypothetical protein